MPSVGGAAETAPTARPHSADPAPPPGGGTLDPAPTEDAYVHGVAANATYDDSRLASRGGTPRAGYPRRTPPAAPPGQGRTGAGTEPALPHSTRPAPSASVPGTITDATPLSTGYPVDPNATARGGALGSAYSFALTSSAQDSLRIRSGEASSAACRPQLVLTFGAE
ncbi:hypothetical protein Sfulv_47720 [Streptomyces fulvorobeus]|uniref:Uncharacterized protein n=1 Tax=Streptomyces fulvorobeus TaxID=284028 RepID=A0A7J0CBT3_9ACTN|nr:hypothetical protein Sfulv_47720 [Streptomyces fulvorobeus]